MEPSFATFRALSASLAAVENLSDLGDRVVAALIADWGAWKAQLWIADRPDTAPHVLSTSSADLSGESWLLSLMGNLTPGTARVLAPEDVVEPTPNLQRQLTENGITVLILVPVAVSDQTRGALVCWMRQIPSDRWMDGLLALVDVVGLSVASLLQSRDRSSERADAHEQADRLNVFLEGIPDAIVVASSAGRIVFVNHQTEAMFGYSRSELLGQPIELLIPESFRDAHRQHRGVYNATLQTRPMGAGPHLLARRQDGHEFPVEISLSPSDTPNGSVVTSVIRDISDRVNLFEAERRARAKAEQLASERSAILGKIADAVILANPAGQVTFVNDAGRRLVPSTNALGDSNSVLDVEVALRDLRTAGGQSLARDRIPLVRAACRGETVAGDELRIQRPNGKEYIVEASSTPIVAENGERLGAVMTIHNVTAQRDLERQKDEFLANVSHDLRTPLTAIKASIGVVLAHEPPGTPEPLHRMLVNIELAADRMATLVTDLLELTRLQAGRAPLQLLWCDMSEVAWRAARTIEPLVQTRNQRLEVDVPAKPCFTLADPDRLDRALLNLLGNAQKYGKEKGTIRLSLGVNAAEVVFAVTDDGPGIPKEEQQRIFNRFYRSEAQATQLNQGSGLGLPIARAMVELHGGRIWVDSTPGFGTTFSIALPLASRPGSLIQKDARS